MNAHVCVDTSPMHVVCCINWQHRDSEGNVTLGVRGFAASAMSGFIKRPSRRDCDSRASRQGDRHVMAPAEEMWRHNHHACDQTIIVHINFVLLSWVSLQAQRPEVFDLSLSFIASRLHVPN